ncbi:hypothetical protein E2C01_030416 [Portunus trituberculatus]|uniref:Uncharacterized protein n=1 Tax=Portunus trituberculatus TaxID=210409 RepID=A0A5B7EVN4_PORTR|nr:hypothetical protein [Portunus trituberculatus]
MGPRESNYGTVAGLHETVTWRVHETVAWKVRRRGGERVCRKDKVNLKPLVTKGRQTTLFSPPHRWKRVEVNVRGSTERVSDPSALNTPHGSSHSKHFCASPPLFQKDYLN